MVATLAGPPREVKEPSSYRILLASTNSAEFTIGLREVIYVRITCLITANNKLLISYTNLFRELRICFCWVEPKGPGSTPASVWIQAKLAYETVQRLSSKLLVSLICECFVCAARLTYSTSVEYRTRYSRWLLRCYPCCKRGTLEQISGRAGGGCSMKQHGYKGTHDPAIRRCHLPGAMLEADLHKSPGVLGPHARVPVRSRGAA